MYIPENKRDIAVLIQRYEKGLNKKYYMLHQILKNKEGSNRSKHILIGWLAKFN